MAHGDFDYVVVGSGFTALAFIQKALELDPCAKILCLERGGKYFLLVFLAALLYTVIVVPFSYFSLLQAFGFLPTSRTYQFLSKWFWEDLLRHFPGPSHARRMKQRSSSFATALAHFSVADLHFGQHGAQGQV
jgi:hypothetical protein